MINVNYQKRKNLEVFKGLESSKSLFISNAQNYIPIYNKFFSLNETNYNNVNLNHKWYLTDVCETNEENPNLLKCKVKNSTNNKIKEKDVFFKMAPMIDPYKFLIGKYSVHNEKIFSLPQLNNTDLDCYEKFLDMNNCAYVDGLFAYFSSNLLYTHNFYHGVDYYGSFLGIKNNFTINVFDDIEYLNNSDFFNKNKSIMFKVDDYEYLFQNENTKLKPIIIGNNVSAKSQVSINSFNDEIYEDIFDKNTINLNDLKNMSGDLVDITNVDLNEHKKSNESITLKSTSSCSSRSSHTENEEDCEENQNASGVDSDSENDVWEDEASDEASDEDDELSFEEEKINVTIPKFPVQVICMEYCEDTFDNLILNNDLTKDEWFSALMQIIMILITYQKAFNFTHNDLHTNNVMYNQTDRKFIYYCYKKKYYKVPTFGRIFKIIDFGRSIYKFNSAIFCSDSFQAGGDAATQYNTEPYLNDKKPRLEPNYSFDLCRLACSIFDYVIEDFSEIKDVSKCKDPVKRIIFEWCLDDNGVNMLYKNNGQDRYPDFKLYKMIARCVHNHTPQAQLERPEFDNYSKFKDDVPTDIINIDVIPSYI